MEKKHIPFPPEIAHNPKPKPVQSAYRPPLTKSAWSSGQLSTKPFWETNKDTTTTTTTTASQITAPFPQRQQQHAAPPSPPIGASNWGMQPMSDPALISPLPPQQSTPNPSPQSSISRKQRRILGSYASKCATHGPPHSIAPSTGTPSSTSIPAATPSIPHFTVAFTASSPTTTPMDTAITKAPSSGFENNEPRVISGTLSLTNLLTPPSPPAPAKIPLFDLDIELIAGVTTRLPIYETDDYKGLVKDFAQTHSLTFAPSAEEIFANHIKQMVDELKVLRAQDNQ